jgi:DNA replication protein DnaC
MTSMIAAELAKWQHRIAHHPEQGDAYADKLIAATDHAEMAAIRQRQAANRHKSYERHRPVRYAAASYDELRPEQNPRRMVSTWWNCGPRSLVIAGTPGTGKTWAAYAIANAAHNAHHWVVATSAGDLSAALKPDGEPAAYDHAAGCDLLVIDDLGRERRTDWWLEQLQRLVDTRCANMNRLLITTNARACVNGVDDTYDDLAEWYGEPIADRLIDGGGVIGFTGPRLRKIVATW